MYHNSCRALVAAAALAAFATAVQAGETVNVRFINHLQAGLNEIDVFTVRPGEPSSQVYRPTPAEKEEQLKRVLYASSGAVAHNPFDAAAVGPFAKGRPLRLTLEQWLSAKGEASVTCKGGKGEVRARFAGLVPDGVYTMWYAFVPQPPTKPFTGALDLPLGARDGSQTRFVAEASGEAHFAATFAPCLQPSNEQLLAMLAIAWHSDGKTYGSSAGPFGHTSHVQIFVPLPRRGAVTD
jgi:hypothetical protein